VTTLVNGIPTEHINFWKGLKQGDPLASVLVISKELQLEIPTYRCLICNLRMVLFSYGRLVWRSWLFKGIKIGDLGVCVSHLKYADDTLFVGRLVWRIC
jgi:hypothetical protein